MAYRLQPVLLVRAMGEPSEHPGFYGSYERDADHAFPDERVHEVLDVLGDSTEVQAYLEAQNVNPVSRLNFNDHGPTHIDIVTDRALSLYDLLKRNGVTFTGATDHGLAEADEAVIVGVAATLHDIGYVVHQPTHSHWSVPLAADVIDRVLGDFYDTAELVRMRGEILHAIICHHVDEQPLTKEAGIVRVADGLDMERGRSRAPFESGGRGINTVSSRAIEAVHLFEGKESPVRVDIEMTDAAGVYQVDTLLKAKLQGSGLEEFIRIVAVNIGSGDERIVERLEL